MKRFLEQLKLQAESNPLGALAAGSAVILAITKLANANTERQRAKSWDREVERRRMTIR